MTRRPRLHRLGPRVMAVAAVVLAAEPVFAQSVTLTTRGLDGSWERYPQRAAGLGSENESAIRPPAPVPDPPLKPEYLTVWQEERARNAELTREGLPPVSSGMACLPEGMPAMMQSIFPMEVIESPGRVTVIQEAFNQVRRIYLDEALIAPEEAEPRFSGHSVGHWEGDTLVVETVGVKDYVQFRNTPHSMTMRITERLRLVNDEFMENQVTVVDPEYLTEPWTWTWMYRRWPDYQIQEYVCEDNRYFEDPNLKYQRLRVD